MRFEGEFTVPASPAEVLKAFEDVEAMAACMPGASIQGRDDSGLYEGSMTVAFGPKKIRFKGKVESSVDTVAQTGRLHVKGAAEMRMAAPASVEVNYAVREAGGAPQGSIVSLVSQASLGGVLADFARTGGIAVTQALMEMFAQNLAAGLRQSDARDEVITPNDFSPSRSATSKADNSISAWRLLWFALKARFARTSGQQ